MFAMFIVKNKNRKYVQIVTTKTVKDGEYDTDMKFFTPPFKATATDMRYFVRSKFFRSLVH